MMDELELLKKDWQQKEEQLPKLSYNEIYTMIWKKSSSIVKWIFYVSIAELIFWIILAILPFLFTDFQEILSGIDDGFTKTFMWVSNTITFGIILTFIYFLYNAYRSITVVDNVKSLMESILRTRKIVKYYVGYNVIMAILVFTYSIYHVLTHDENAKQLLKGIREDDSEFKFWIIVVFISALGIMLMVGFIWLFYRLIYGFLLKKLNRNYKELKRLEI